MIKRILFISLLFLSQPIFVNDVFAATQPLLKVNFQGTFNGITYIPYQGEIVNGTLVRSGTNDTPGTGKITLSGNSAGLTFLSGLPLDDGQKIIKNLVVEAVSDRGAVDMTYNTLLSFFGSVFYRYRYDSPSTSEFGLVTYSSPQIISKEAFPMAGVSQHIALVYTIQNNSVTLDAYLNGCKTGTITGSSPARKDGEGIGFGRDVHPQAGNRGWNGNLYSIATTSFTGIFNPSADFQILPKSVAPGSLIPVSNCDTSDQKMKKAANVIPSSAQKAWQDLELTAFIHFGMNTFTGLDWGWGLESPSLFNPTELDTRQWVRTLKEAGFKSVILTTKHHDGFALWPTRYSSHSVKASPWKNGQGDVVGELAQAARAEGLKFGVYISVLDLHQAKTAGGLYGNNSPSILSDIPTLVQGDDRRPGKTFRYKLNDFNRFFLNQLYELLTQYGPVNEVWLDFGGPKEYFEKEQYNETAWYDMIKGLAPDAVIILGPDGRWVGNEGGIARPSEWSVIPMDREPLMSGVFNWKDTVLNLDLGSREKWTAEKKFFAWWPAENDVSIRPNWFYLQNDDQQVRSLSNLINLYHTSVGRNSNLLLNIPPDKRGLFTDFDVSRLKEFGSWLNNTFSHDIAQGATVNASNNNPFHPAGNATDGNPDTYWQMDETQTSGELILTFPSPVIFNEILLSENISVGQRVEAFALDYWDGNNWLPARILNGLSWWTKNDDLETTTIGHKKLIRIWPTASQKVRLRILSSRLAPAISQVGLYYNSNLGDIFSCQVSGPNSLLPGETGKFQVTSLGSVARTQLFYSPISGQDWKQIGPDCLSGGNCTQPYTFDKAGNYYIVCNAYSNLDFCTGNTWYRATGQKSCGVSSYYTVNVSNVLGDLDSDGDVDIFDYNLFIPNFGKTGSPGFIPSDIDKNSKVDIFDYNLLVQNFGKFQ